MRYITSDIIVLTEPKLNDFLKFHAISPSVACVEFQIKNIER